MVRLATTSPPSPSREEREAPVPVPARKHFRRNLRRGPAVLNEPASSSPSPRVDDRRASNDRFTRFAIVNSAVLIAHSGSKTVQLAAFLAVNAATLWRRTRLTDAGSGRRAGLGFPARGKRTHSDERVPRRRVRPQAQTAAIHRCRPEWVQPTLVSRSRLIVPCSKADVWLRPRPGGHKLSTQPKKECRGEQ